MVFGYICATHKTEQQKLNFTHGCVRKGPPKAEPFTLFTILLPDPMGNNSDFSIVLVMDISAIDSEKCFTLTDYHIGLRNHTGLSKMSFDELKKDKGEEMFIRIVHSITHHMMMEHLSNVYNVNVLELLKQHAEIIELTNQ